MREISFIEDIDCWNIRYYGNSAILPIFSYSNNNSMRGYFPRSPANITKTYIYIYTPMIKSNLNLWSNKRLITIPNKETEWL